MQLFVHLLGAGAFRRSTQIRDVAVIGMAAAVTTASGIFAFGTRSATLPVLAVTFSGTATPLSR